MGSATPFVFHLPKILSTNYPSPVDLADKAMAMWLDSAPRTAPDPIDPYTYQQRRVESITLGEKSTIGPLEPPRVVYQARDIIDLSDLQKKLGDAKIEGLLIDTRFPVDFRKSVNSQAANRTRVDFIIWQLSNDDARELLPTPWAGNARCAPYCAHIREYSASWRPHPLRHGA